MFLNLEDQSLLSALPRSRITLLHAYARKEGPEAARAYLSGRDLRG